MTFSLIGSVDHVIDGNGNFNGVTNPKFRAANDLYTSMYNFLTSSNAQALGIVRISRWNGTSGSGDGYWDEPHSSGENAWSCFGFMSASFPFFILIQYSGAETFGTVFANTGSLGANATNGVGIAFAMKQDTGVPWQGTIYKNGGDTKGWPVWSSASHGLIAFPRANSLGGLLETGSYGLMCLSSADALTSDIAYTPTATGDVPSTCRAFQSRAHFLATKDHFMAICDLQGNGTSNFVFFGKFDPVHEDNITPYACLAANAYNAGGVDGNWIARYSGEFWPWGGRNNSQLYNQFTPPSAYLSGGVVNPYFGFTQAVGIEIPKQLFPVSSSYGISIPNQKLTGLAPKLVMFNIPICAAEYSSSIPSFIRHEHPTPISLLGEISFLKLVTNVVHSSLINSGAYAVFGPSQTGAVKFAVPWSQTLDKGPGLGRNRYGLQFTVP